MTITLLLFLLLLMFFGKSVKWEQIKVRFQFDLTGHHVLPVAQSATLTPTPTPTPTSWQIALSIEMYFPFCQE